MNLFPIRVGSTKILPGFSTLPVHICTQRSAGAGGQQGGAVVARGAHNSEVGRSKLLPASFFVFSRMDASDSDRTRAPKRGADAGSGDLEANLPAGSPLAQRSAASVSSTDVVVGSPPYAGPAPSRDADSLADPSASIHLSWEKVSYFIGATKTSRGTQLLKDIRGSVKPGQVFLAKCYW